jgi:hypothetical protein
MKQSPVKWKLRHVLVAALLLISVSSTVLVNSAEAQTQANVTVDPDRTIATNDYSVGFAMDHVMNYDERDFLYNPTTRQLARDANFKLVRIVDFRSNFQVCTRWYESSQTGSFDWATLDDLVEKIYDVGAEPLVVLGSVGGYGVTPNVPRGMAINPSTGLPYPDSFAAYAAEWVRHFNSKGLPVRFYEIFNEAWYYFWYSWGSTNTAKRANFVTLMNTVYDRMRAVNRNVLIGTDSTMFRSFLDYYVNNGRGLGFLSFHKYDSGSLSTSDSSILNAADRTGLTTDNTRYSPNDARETWFNSRGVNLPVIITEVNLSWLWNGGTDPRIQKMIGAVWTALMIRACITQGVQYSLYYKLLSSQNTGERTRTGGYGFGLINSDNDQPWYPYYVHQMVGTNLEIGDPIVSSSSSRSEISPLAWIHGDKLNILLINEVTYERAIRLYGISGQLNYFKIDNAISWRSPRVQTGVISASNTITFNGYTVMLLQQDVDAPPPTPPPNPPPTPPPASSFADGFESGDFSAWTVTTTTSGETTTVATTAPHHGTYHGRFTSNGGGGIERAYASKDVTETSEIYVRGYLNIQGGLPLRDENDRFNLIAFRGTTAGQIIASVSVQRSSGMSRWTIRGQAGALYASTGPSANQWYCVEFYTRISTTNGIYRLWVDDQMIIEKTGLNTAGAGSIDYVRFGLTYLNGVSSSVTVYGDCVVISDAYVGPETETSARLDDDFESGDFSAWTGTSATSGETATVATYNPYDGTYHARFYSNGGGGTERAYCYIETETISEVYVRAYVNVQTGLPLDNENDRFNVMAIRGNTRGWIIANVIVQRTGGVDRWGVKSISGTWFASTGPSENRWYSVELSVRVHSTDGSYRLWIDGNKVIERTGLNTATEGYIDSIRFGLTYIYSVTHTVRVYGDNFIASDAHIGP